MTGMILVFALIAVTIALFIWQPFPIEVTALGVAVVLMVLEPWTGISVEEGVSGFSNPATLTVLAMLILSEGVRRTGLLQTVGEWAVGLIGRGIRRQLLVTTWMSGPVSGFINNTPVVALLVPVVSNMAHKVGTSPSKLLIPLSYAAMLGGMLTLLGTSTNLLASELSQQYLGHPFSMFEFTQLGVIVFLVGSAYLVVAAPVLLPARVKPQSGLAQNEPGRDFITEIEITEGGPFVGRTIASLDLANTEVIYLVRDEAIHREDPAGMELCGGDVLLLQAPREAIGELIARDGIHLAPRFAGGPLRSRQDVLLAEIIIPSNSQLAGARLGSLPFEGGLGVSCLALRRRGADIREDIQEIPLRPGDMLIVAGGEEDLERLNADFDLILLRRERAQAQRRERIPLALAIVVAVVALAAADVVPILVSSLGGAVLMFATGIVRPSEVYHAIRWDVVLLLAGIIPLGMALEQTGGAALLGEAIAKTGDVLPPIAVLWVFYVATALITEVISNNASAVLMIPVAVQTARAIHAEPFSFVLVVTFAASLAFLGPVGYQTNLFVYGPGGYKVTDFTRVGAPLQLIMSVVVPGGIALFWGL